jgi:hypothetical protein
MQYTVTQHPISWFHDAYREGKLIIKPRFQRKPVWKERQKCYLVESILMGLPIPEVYIQRTTTAEGVSEYAIVDGQQRIRTVLQFVGSETDPTEERYNKFSLDKLETSSDYYGLAFADLTGEQRKKFFDYDFAVRYLNTESDDDVRDMFRRLNKFLTPLTAQELRNATYSGPFVALVNKLADDEYWVENPIIAPASIRRMGDLEFVSELLIGIIHGPQGTKDIDDYYAQYEDFEDEFPDQKRAQRQFSDTLNTIRTILPDIKKTRWGNKTDFYTLFLTMAQLLRSGVLVPEKVTLLHNTLEKFEKEVDLRLRDETASVRKEAIDYVRAVEKGATDKKRRADRQAALTAIIQRYFKAKKQGK